MLPPVLEIYAVWHPEDPAGQTAANQLVSHFHGSTFSGLIGGAVEVYVRSQGWLSANGAPRPIPFPGAGPPNDVLQAEIVAIVPILGREFARAVEAGPGPWRDYALGIAAARAAQPERVCVLPLLIHQGATNGTELGRIFGGLQFLASVAPGAPVEPEAELRCRDLAQAIAQLVGPQPRLQIFISHTKHPSAEEESGVTELIDRVRWIIGQTRLAEFFDANALQPGGNWDNKLRQGATVGALIALRTDLYSSREWCQREMLLAKQSGLPVVILDVLGGGDERGSFLMDHVPRVPVRRSANVWSDADIRRALNRLVDEILKRELWRCQRRLTPAGSRDDVAWWAPHAPEPATLVHWLASHRPTGAAAPQSLRVLHPDPPLGPDERLVLDEIATLGGFPALDIMTPRLLAARGG